MKTLAANPTGFVFTQGSGWYDPYTGETHIDFEGAITVGFRPEAVTVGDGPLQAQVRTAEDLGPEVFVHLAVDHHGESLSLVSKMAPPFEAEPGDHVGLQLTGTTHFFDAGGMRVVSTRATLR